MRQSNSYLNAEETVIKTGKDANFKGAVVKTDHLEADIQGNLNLESRQDSNHYDSKQTKPVRALVWQFMAVAQVLQRIILKTKRK